MNGEARQDRNMSNHNHKAIEVEYSGSSESKRTWASKEDEARGYGKNKCLDT
jgi:hypothetical protein